MKNERKAPVMQMSRRAFLRASGGVAVGGIVVETTSRRAAASAKLSQQVVAYQDHPDGGKRCDQCTHFQAPNACRIVAGVIRPDGYCRFFTARNRA